MSKFILPDIVTGYPLDKTSYGELAFVIPEEGVNLVTSPVMDSIAGYTGSNATVAQSIVEQKFSYFSAKVEHTAHTPYAVYRNITLAAVTYYTFSAYIKCRRGTRVWIEARATNYGALVVRKQYTCNGEWQRMILTFSTLLGVTAYSLSITAVYVSPGYFYTDGWQLENKKYATTFFWGSGNIWCEDTNPNAYYWNGTQHASSSTRAHNTRDGGRIVTIADLGMFLTGISGLGFRGVQNNILTLNDGSGFMEDSIQTQRQFSIALSMYGTSYEDIVQKMSRLQQCIYSLPQPTKEPIKLILIRYDEWGQPAREVEIKCFFAGSVESEINNVYQKKIVLTFDMPVPSILDSGNNCLDLVFTTALDTNYVAKMGDNWAWDNLNDGFDAAVYDIIQTSDGNIWACGAFANANGVQCRRVAYWNGTIWNEAAALTAGTAYCMATDGTYIWVGGADLVYGGVTIQMIRITISTLAVTTYPYVHVTSGFDGMVLALCYDPKYGRLYIGGKFQHSGTFEPAAGGAGIVGMLTATGVFFNMFGIGAADTDIRSICLNNSGDVCVTGSFAIIGIGDINLTVDDVAVFKWDTGQWYILGSYDPLLISYGLVGAGHYGHVIRNGPDGNIYLGGTFTSINGVTAANIAKLVGGTWVALGSGVTAAAGTAKVLDITWDKWSNMYLCGRFTSAGGVLIPESIAEYVSGYYLPLTLWTGLAPGEFLSIFVSSSNEIYVGITTTDASYVSVGTTELVQEEVWPVFVLIGPGSIMSIANRSNGKAIWFSGLNLIANEVAIINITPFGTFYASSIGRNIGNYVLGGSDIDFNLSKGSNIINAFIYVNNTGATHIYMLYRKAFNGIEATSDAAI